MANEESFHSFIFLFFYLLQFLAYNIWLKKDRTSDRTSDLSANRKRKRQATVENGRSGKSRRWCDAEVDRLIELLEERPCLWDVFCKEYHVSEKRERAYEKILYPDRLIPSVESNMLRSFGHLVEHCATSSNNVGFNNVG